MSQAYLNQQFKFERHGTVQVVTVKEVRRDKVVVQQEGRQDRETVPLARFEKFYRPLRALPA